MQAAEALNKICGEYTAVSLTSTKLNTLLPDDDGELVFQYVTDPNVRISVSTANITATLLFEERETYKEFLAALEQIANIEMPNGYLKENIITFSPWQDDMGGVQIYAAGWLGQYQNSDSQLAVRFIFGPDEFEVYSFDLNDFMDEPWDENPESEDTVNV